MLLELFVIGLVVGFIYYEWVGLSPGGMIPPAYFALYLTRPDRMGMTVLVSLAVYLLLRLLSRHTVLYGRRKLLLAVLLGVSLKWLVELGSTEVAFLPVELNAIGYVIPGLIANEMLRQKVWPTLASLGIVTLITGLIALLFGIGIAL